jgi:hypothetical protein
LYVRKAGSDHDLRRISNRTEILRRQGDVGAKFFAKKNNVRLIDQSAKHDFGTPNQWQERSLVSTYARVAKQEADLHRWFHS